jgi:hypothetical protein
VPRVSSFSNAVEKSVKNFVWSLSQGRSVFKLDSKDLRCCGGHKYDSTLKVHNGFHKIVTQGGSRLTSI